MLNLEIGQKCPNCRQARTYPRGLIGHFSPEIVFYFWYVSDRFSVLIIVQRMYTRLY